MLLFPATQLVTHPDLSFPFHAVVYNFAAAGRSVRGRSVGDNRAVVSIFEVVLQFQDLAISTRVDALDLRWAQNGAHRCGVNPSVETVWNWHTCSLMVFPSHSFSSLSGWHSAGEAEASSAGEQLAEE